MDENFAYLLGALRDGYLTRKCIEFLVKDENWAKELAKILELCAGKKARVSKVKQTYFRCRLRSVKFCQEFLKISEFRTPQSFWQTPKAIMDAPENLQRSYVSGFFDAEGSVSKVQKNYLNVDIYQAWNNETSCPPLEDIKNILNKNGIRTSRVYINKKPSIGRNYALFRLNISNKESVMKFSEWIHSLYDNRRRRLCSSTP